jgi:peroxisomal membrane protein 4
MTMDDLHPHSLTSEIKAIVESLFAGARYGMKIRFPHALVMTFLFRRDMTTDQKVRTILKLVGEHSSNLAAFAALYKVSIRSMQLV